MEDQSGRRPQRRASLDHQQPLAESQEAAERSGRAAGTGWFLSVYGPGRSVHRCGLVPGRPSRAGSLNDLTVRLGGHRVIHYGEGRPGIGDSPPSPAGPRDGNERAASSIPGSLLRYAPARDPMRPDRVPAPVHQARARRDLPRLYRPSGQAPAGLGADRDGTSRVASGGGFPLGRSLPRATLPCRPLVSLRRAADLPSPVSSRSSRARRSRRAGRSRRAIDPGASPRPGFLGACPPGSTATASSCPASPCAPCTPSLPQGEDTTGRAGRVCGSRS